MRKIIAFVTVFIFFFDLSFAHDKKKHREMATEKYLKGQTYQRLGMNQEAWQALNEAYDIFPDENIKKSLKASTKALAEELIIQGNYEEAQRILDKGLASFPDDLEILTALASFYYESGRYFQATGVLSRIIDKTNDPSARKILAKIRVKVDDLNGAIVEYSKILQSYPDDYSAHLEKGLVHLRLGQFGPASDHLVRASKNNEKKARSFCEKLIRILDSKEIKKTKISGDIKGLTLIIWGFDKEEQLKALKEAMEKAYKRVGSRFGFYPSIPIHINNSKEEFFKAPDPKTGLGGKWEICVDFQGEMPNLQDLEWELWQKHTTYAIDSISDGMAPLWFIKGLAFSEGVKSGEDDIIEERKPDSENPPEEATVLKKRHIFSLQSLEAGIRSNDKVLAGNSEKIAFDLVDFIEKKGGKGVMERILKRLSNRESFEDSIRSELYLNLSELIEKWEKER